MADQTSGEACGHEPLCSLRDVDEMPSERRCTCQPGAFIKVHVYPAPPITYGPRGGRT